MMKAGFVEVVFKDPDMYRSTEGMNVIRTL
jgi:hypothetical protein